MAVRGSPTRHARKDVSCPTCGAPAERGQLVCLECGTRLALTYRRPPSWKVPVAIVAVLGAVVVAGAVIAYDAISDDAREEVTATPPAPKQAASSREGAKAGGSARTGGTGGLVKRGRLHSWPRSLEAFTVVLLSTDDERSAVDYANRVADRNDAKAGVIRSSDFAGLPQGPFVAFAGAYRSREEAGRAVARLKPRYPGAVAQAVKR